MLNELFDIIYDLNEDRVYEAANKILKLVKDIEDENIIRLASEIEKEIRSIKEDEDLVSIVDNDFTNDLINAIYDMKKARELKIKVLIKQIIKKMSKGNVLVVEALKPKTEIKPHTFI